MKKHLLRFLLISACLVGMLFMSACASTPDGGGTDEPPVVVMRVVKFFSEDGLTLIAQKQVEDGNEVVYDGSTLKKQADDKFTYVFSGWAKSVGGAVEQKIVADKNLELYAVFEPRAVEREKVEKPVADATAFVYTGEQQRYVVAESDKYKVIGAVKTDAGEYTVTVSLKDKTHTCWADGGDADIEFDFVIAKADNAWTETPHIDDWSTDGAASVPHGAAAFGTVVWTFGETEDGEFTALPPTQKGSYYAKASVAATDNYNSIEITVAFNVFSDTYTIIFANADGVEIARREIRKQTDIVWDGDTPEKAGDAQYGYTFDGWSGTLGGDAETLVADGDKTVYAAFTRYTKSYTVVFADADGELESKTLEYGVVPQYTGAALGSGDGNIVLEFVCWKRGENEYDDELPAVVGDVTYTAVYRSVFNDSYGSQENPFVFVKRSELVFLANSVADGYVTDGKYYKLGGDIDLTDCGYSAVGTQENMFKGIFDGDGHTVTVEGVCGVFAYNAGNVRGLNVVADIDGVETAGGVAAFNSGTVISCTVRGIVRASVTAGGVVGVNSGRVELCHGKAAVKLNGKYIMTGAQGDGGVIVGKSNSGAAVYASSVWDGTEVAASFASGDGSEASPYIIETAAQLAYFKDSLSANAYYANKYIKLAADIDLDGKTWSGIGGGSSNNGFKGVFDGDGHTVYNAALTYGSRKGFFNSASGTIKNFDLFATMSGTTSVQYVGLLVGINSAAIQNCNVYGTLDAVGTYIAIVSGWSYGDITDCCAYGYVTGTNMVGGVIGYDIKQGGVIGKLEGLKNYATVTSSDDFAVTQYTGIGGIVALVGSDAVVDGCINYGDIVCTGAASDGGTGGIVGHNYSTPVTDCKNYGSVTANSAAGGIVGYGREGGSVSGCTNYGHISGVYEVGGIIGCSRINVSQCGNFGEVTGKSGSYWIGGISGMQGGGNNGTSVEGCENSGRVVGVGGTSGGVGGIAGSSYSNVEIKRCTNRSAIEGNDGYCGGLVGINMSGSSVAYCDNYGGNALFGSDDSAEELVYGNTNHTDEDTQTE